MAAKREKILKDAEKLVQKGKVEQAIREYEKLLKDRTTDANTINRVGDLYGRIGQIDKAVELYERIADHFTTDGFTTKAIAILKKINRLAPQRLDIFNKLAELYIQQGLIVEAQSQYQILADWYAKNGDHENAIETHKKLVQLDPSNHMAHLRLADLLNQQGDTEEALKVYNRLGRVLIKRDKLDEAERLYRHALEQSPPDGDFLAPLCEALLEGGRSTSAREFLDAALERSPNSHDLQVLKVRAHLVFGESEQAMGLAQQVLDDQPDDTGVRLLMGRAMLSSGATDEARGMLIPTCEKLLDTADYAAAQKLLQELMTELPQDQQVLELAVKAFRPSGDQETLQNLTASLAESYYHSGNTDDAEQLYMDLLHANPTNDMFRQRLAELQGVTADKVEIKSITSELTGPQPVMAVESIDVSEFYEGDEVIAGEVKSPAAPQADAVGSGDGPFDAGERLAEAKVFAKYGLLEKATVHLEEILRHFPDQVDARAILVSLYVEQGETEAALPVAGPLYAHYREQGDDGAVEALLASLPELEDESDQLAEAIADDDEEVIVLEIDADELEAAMEFDGEPDVGEPIHAAEVVEASDLVEVGEIAPAEYEASAEELAEPMPEPLDDFVIDLDGDQEQPVFSEAAPEPEPELETVFEAEPEPESAPATDFEPEPMAELEAEPAAEPVAASPLIQLPTPRATPPEPEELEEEPDELVEISHSFTGPAVSELDQLDFFIDQDLHEDAIRLLGRLESEFPDDAEVQERRLALKAKGVLLEEVVAVTDGTEQLFADEEESYIDLAKELEQELAEEEAMVDEATGRGKEEAILEEVFREFQKGVAEQLSEADSDTHFNLGIAYKEMGLLPEAIREFQVSSRDPRLFVECCSMIGVCYVEQGMWSQAVEWYTKALGAPELPDEARLALRYDLAAALESAGEREQAMGVYQQVAAANPAYRDVSNRITTLSQNLAG